MLGLLRLLALRRAPDQTHQALALHLAPSQRRLQRCDRRIAVIRSRVQQLQRVVRDRRLLRRADFDLVPVRHERLHLCLEIRVRVPRGLECVLDRRCHETCARARPGGPS